jgi:hypothetical protein
MGPSPIGSSPLIGPGEKATPAVPTATTAAAPHATGRQRAFGNRPLGNSNDKNSKRPMSGTHNHEAIQVSISPAGNDSGLAINE